MRLGDLDKLEIGLRNMAKYQSGERQQGIWGCCETIRLAPTVDAVPVVRCKDCENAIDIGKEYLLCPMIDCRVKANFFCAYGEGKKDGN